MGAPPQSHSRKGLLCGGSQAKPGGMSMKAGSEGRPVCQSPLRDMSGWATYLGCSDLRVFMTTSNPACMEYGR